MIFCQQLSGVVSYCKAELKGQMEKSRLHKILFIFELCFFHSINFFCKLTLTQYCPNLQKSVHTWVRVHRTHHKFSDTDKDPVNINRGFFHAAIGWFLIEQPPECAIELERIYMDDVKADSDLNFQLK